MFFLGEIEISLDVGPRYAKTAKVEVASRTNSSSINIRIIIDSPWSHMVMNWKF